MNFIASNQALGQFGFFIIAVIVIAIIVGLAEAVACVLNIIVFAKTRKINKTESECQLDGMQVARNLLDNMGMNDVQVVKAGFFRVLFYGDYYDPKKKTIYLRKSVIEGKSVRTIASTVLNVAYAEGDKNGDKTYARSAKIRPFMMFAPYIFIPLVLVGLVLDVLIAQAIGTITAICSIVGFVYYLWAIIYFCTTIPQLKKAMARSSEIIKQTNLLNENEQIMVDELYKYTVMAEIANMILAIIYMLKYLVKILGYFTRRK